MGRISNAEVIAIDTQAENLGREFGRSVGSWVIDANTTRETCELIIQGYEDGDPEIMDMEPAPLSGEWADSPTPTGLARELGTDEMNDDFDDVCRAFEDGFSHGYWEIVISNARAQTL